MNAEDDGEIEVVAEARCGDPTCEICVAPSARCEACGALIWGQPLPYCSAECAGARHGTTDRN